MEVCRSEDINRDRPTMLRLQDMLHGVNRHVVSFKSVCSIPDDNVQNLTFVLRKEEKLQMITIYRRYNLPTVNEIALIAPNETVESGDIVLYKKEGGVKRIS